MFTIPHGFLRTKGPPWSVDALSGKGVPANAAEWTDLYATLSGGGIPSHLYLMQESSGDLTDSIGSLTFSASGTPSYSNSISGWSRLAVGSTDGTSGTWTNISAAPVASSTSMAMLGYVRIDNATTERAFMFINGTTNHLVQLNVTGAGLLRYYIGSTGFLGSVNREGGSVFPALMVYDRTNSLAAVYTENEKVTATYSNVTLGSTKRWAHTAPPTAMFLFGAIWTGTAAEWLSTDSNAKSLLTRLGWTVSGY